MEDIYAGHRVMIKHMEDGRAIADTTVLHYDHRTMSIFVRPNSLLERGNISVLVAILVDDGLNEFKGRMKSAVRDNEVEIGLAEYKHVNNRGSQRYAIFSEGKITHILVGDQTVELRRTIGIHSLNMSSGGILIASEAGALMVGQCFRMLISVGEGNRVQMECQVVRVQNSGSITEEYGCKITGMWKAQG